jgi:uncharacterized protein (DUF486 family)
VYDHTVYSAAQLKTMQEIMTLIVFAVFSVTWLGEAPRWNHAVAFVSLCDAAFCHFTTGTSPVGRPRNYGRPVLWSAETSC